MGAPAVSIRYQPQPVWTDDFISHVERHARVYNQSFAATEIAAERQRVRDGSPSPRHSGTCYEILVDDDVAGEIVVSVDSGEGDHELTVSVFDELSGQGVAKEALRQFIDVNDAWPLSAVVRACNMRRDKVVGLLETLGFRICSAVDGGNTCLRLDRA